MSKNEEKSSKAENTHILYCLQALQIETCLAYLRTKTDASLFHNDLIYRTHVLSQF